MNSTTCRASARFTAGSRATFSPTGTSAASDGPRSLRPPRSGKAAARDEERRVGCSRVGREFNKPWLVDREPNWEASASMRHWEDLAWRMQDDTENVLLARAVGCAKRRAPRTCAWRAVSRSIASPTAGSRGRRDSKMYGSSRRRATTELRSAAPITVTWRF